MTYVNRSLELLCYELTCQARIPGICAGGRGEPSHSNRLVHGHGTGQKAHSCFVASLCRACHRAIDQGLELTREQKQMYWQGAFERTLLEFWSRGLLQVVGSVPREAQASPKQRPRTKVDLRTGRLVQRQSPTAAPDKIRRQKEKQ